MMRSDHQPACAGLHKPNEPLPRQSHGGSFAAPSRFDRRIRVGGMAELAGFDLSLRDGARQTLQMVTEDLFPGASEMARGQFWTGLRPMTPDGTPVIGATSVLQLFINTGHGTLGWTMAAGSGRLIADLVTRRKPDIDPDGFGIERYRPAAVPQRQPRVDIRAA